MALVGYAPARMSDEPVIEFFFDVGSPYSYLAATQVDAVGERAGAEVRWRPFLLGGVFKESGNDMPARVAAKARWMLADLGRWAEAYGVPFRFASRFPLNTLQAQRALTAAAQRWPESLRPFALSLFRAYWVDDRDVSRPDEIGAAAEGAGLDGDAVLAAAQEQEVKDLLRSWTSEAVERGAFGAPTFFVGEEMYWGNDRLDLMERNLRAVR